uniref:Mitochondrial import inner membrane translocase subunit n=1 Tax=Strigamia maritima TaxID=126957 RepID=T1IQX1_STRMM
MSFGDDLPSEATAQDSELQDFLYVEQQKAQFQSQVHRLNEICWDKCVEKPGQKLDSKTEACISNCVDRFIDTSLAITTRFAQLLQKNAAGSMMS